MRLLLLLSIVSLLTAMSSPAIEFTGPSEWLLVNTNAVKSWQASQKQGELMVLKGVVADKTKREVRLLAEAVGHAVGTTAEFLLVAPASDRAYEAAAVTVADPADIVKAMEFIGVQRGNCVDSYQFRFWAYGERCQIFSRRLDVAGAQEHLISSLLADSQPDDSLLVSGFVFTGGKWRMEGGEPICLTSIEPPCSVVSLYNQSSTLFDLPQQSGQSEVYGRLTLAQKLPYGTLLEVILRPVSSEPMVLPVEVTAALGDDNALRLLTRNLAHQIERNESMESAMAWMRAQGESGKDLFVTLQFDPGLSVRQARDVARLFSILDGNGIKLYGKGKQSLYYRALLPQESWRKHEDRNPQPFEVHLTRDAADKLQKKLVFIEEDWSGEGLDPKLIPKEYSFELWSELDPLVVRAGGKDNKVTVVFFFVPADLKLADFMPAVDAVSKRLPLVHVFVNE
ncbi:MAG: hypothetical protein PHO37_17445 [Kiritimatiellae bacterium]|nr:hypothetical protein [Kiritimatiellia bacterium]